MRDYELVLILHPDTTEEKTALALERVSGFVAAHGGEVADTDHWGRRRLAYPIRRQLEGDYYCFQLKLSPPDASALEGQIKLTEEVMRHLLVRKDEE